MRLVRAQRMGTPGCWARIAIRTPAQRFLHDVLREFDAARDRREHHLEGGVAPAVQILKIRVQPTHGHQGAIAGESFSGSVFDGEPS